MVKIVKIKTWEEMKEEFTYYAGDGLWVNGMHFNKEMEKELPQDRIIEINYYPQYNHWLWIIDITDYVITKGMIKEEITEDKEVIVPNPTNPINPIKLSEFLEEQGCYNAFVKNFDKDWGYEKCKESLDEIIGFAFEWDKTDEGYDYWKNISDKWIYLENKENDIAELINNKEQPKGVIETFVDKMTSDKEVKENNEDKKMSKKASIKIKDFKITEDEVQITISKEEFAKELSLYGKIVEDINQETILGYLRITSFNYIDKGFTVIKLNGEVLTIKEFL